MEYLEEFEEEIESFKESFKGNKYCYFYIFLKYDKDIIEIDYWKCKMYIV